MLTKQYLHFFQKNKALSYITLAVVVLLVLVLPLTVFLAKQSQQTRQYAAGSQFITKSGTQLLANGQSFRLTGYNWHWSGYNCPAPATSDIDTVFSQIQTASKGNVVRTAFYQAAYQPGTANPWQTFDNYITYAKKYNIYLVPILVNNWKDCEPQQAEKFLPWYQSGYTGIDSGYTMSYHDWAVLVAQHYANEPAIAWWQLENEPDARNSDGTCSESTAATALRSFADTMTGVIKIADPNHMVELGSISWCGGQGSDFQTVNAGSVDLCDAFHDYTNATIAFPSGLQNQLNACKSLNKPSYVGEAGICADVDTTGTCTGTVSSTTLQNRANFFDAKLNAGFTNGLDGYIIWSKGQNSSSGFGVGPGDPVESILAKYALTVSGAPTLPPSATPTPTPALTATVIAQDTFQRPNQTLWGTASDGHVWAGDANGNSVFSINNNAGQVANGSTAYNAVLGPGVTDSQSFFTGLISSFSGANLGAVIHWQDTNNWYKAYIDGSNLVIQKKVNGTNTTLATTPFSATVNTAYSLRFQIIGTSLSAKVWQASGTEPANWMASATDSLFPSGKCGLRMQVASGVTATYTSFIAYSLTGATPTVTPTATNTPTPVPTDTPLPTPTLTPIPTFTPIPTPTITPLPTLTSTPVPTNTPVPTSTPIPTPTPTPLDTIPPSVAIISPVNGATVRHASTVTITATDSDNVGVTKVEFLVNGTLLCSNTNPSSPTSCNWPVPSKPNITYTLVARAYDAAGFASSDSIQVKSSK